MSELKRKTSRPISKEEIISEVQKNELLYNKALPEYKDAKQKDQIWLSIAAKLQIEVGELQKQWKNLRDAYLKIKKDEQVVSGQAAKQHPRWKFFEAMHFLFPHTTNRETSGNLKPPCTSNDAGIFDGEESGLDESQRSPLQASETSQNRFDGETDDSDGQIGTLRSAVPSTASKDSHPPPIGKRKKKEGACDPASVKIIDYLKSRKSTNPQLTPAQPQQPDADSMWLQSLLPSIKRLDHERKSLVKIRIQQLIHDTEFPHKISSQNGQSCHYGEQQVQSRYQPPYQNQRSQLPSPPPLAPQQQQRQQQQQQQQRIHHQHRLLSFSSELDEQRDCGLFELNTA